MTKQALIKLIDGTIVVRDLSTIPGLPIGIKANDSIWQVFVDEIMQKGFRDERGIAGVPTENGVRYISPSQIKSVEIRIDTHLQKA